MKKIPNYLSISRILLALTLFVIRPLSTPFYIVYVLCGISDMLDGFIARKFHAASNLGARLDSIADFVMLVVLLIVLYPVINPPVVILLWIVLIGVLRFASMIVAKRKYGKVAMLHTLANKLTGLALFLFPLFLNVIPKSVVMTLICLLASLSAIEELAVHLTSAQLNLDQKSIFTK